MTNGSTGAKAGGVELLTIDDRRGKQFWSQAQQAHPAGNDVLDHVGEEESQILPLLGGVGRDRDRAALKKTG